MFPYTSKDGLNTHVEQENGGFGFEPFSISRAGEVRLDDDLHVAQRLARRSDRGQRVELVLELGQALDDRDLKFQPRGRLGAVQPPESLVTLAVAVDLLDTSVCTNTLAAQERVTFRLSVHRAASAGQGTCQ